MEQNDEITTKILNDAGFRKVVTRYLREKGNEQIWTERAGEAPVEGAVQESVPLARHRKCPFSQEKRTGAQDGRRLGQVGDHRLELWTSAL